MSGPHGFQLDCSQCDICMIHCSVFKDVLEREEMLLVCQVMNNQGGSWDGKQF